MIPLPPVSDPSQTGRLADELAMQIHLGRLKPGEPLREVELAETHGVSRTIVRAALQRLEGQGLAASTLNKGARVRIVPEEAVDDMIELQTGLAALAARQAAERASDAEVALMAAFVDMMEHVAGEGGPAPVFQHLRVGFARALFAGAGPVLAERLRAAAPVIPHHDRAMDDIADERGMAEAARLSRVLVAAVRRRDAGAAAKSAEALLHKHGERIARRAGPKRSAGKGQPAAR